MASAAVVRERLCAGRMTGQQHLSHKHDPVSVHRSFTSSSRLLLLGVVGTLLVLWLGASPASGQTTCVTGPADPSALGDVCQTFKKVCVDQNVYVLYESKHNPKHPQYEGQLPQIRLQKVAIDYYGFGDTWGTSFEYPQPFLRPATDGEESRDLDHPQFTRCTTPLVLYSSNLYSYADFFVNTVVSMFAIQKKGHMERR
jgi:hypothetical protein